MNKLRKRFWMFLSAFVVCASMIVVVAACNDDEECKECTSPNGDKRTYCGDDLKEAQSTEGVTCK